MLLSLCMRTVDDGWLWLWANVFVWVFISKSIYLQHGRQSSSSVQQFSRSTKRPLSLSFWQVVFDQLFGVLCSSHSVKQVIDAVHFTASHWMPPGDLTVQWGTGNYHPLYPAISSSDHLASCATSMCPHWRIFSRILVVMTIFINRKESGNP